MSEDTERIERNRKRNASLVQCRVPLALRVVLLAQARRRGVSLSKLVAAVLSDHFVVAPKARRG